MTVKERYAPVQDDPVEQAYRIANWSLTFLGDPENHGHYWIRSDVPDIHIGIYTALANEYKYYYVTAPREFAKSTCVQLVYVLYRVVYELEPYILLIEKNGKAGKRTLSNIKYELANNQKIIDVYGKLRPTRTKVHRDYADSAEELRLLNETFIRSVGIDGDIRGALDRMYRYTLVIGNDMQDTRTMREPMTIESNITTWERDVEHAIDSEFGKVRAVGNMLGSGCLLEYIKQDGKYDGVDFSALVDKDGNPDLKGHSVWEDKFPTARLKKEAENYRRKGKLYVFMAERMNIVQDAKSRKLSGYRYHDMQFYHKHGQNVIVSEDFGGIPIPVNTYHLIDPAFAKTDSADARVGLTIACGKFPHRTDQGKIIQIIGVWVLEYDYTHNDPSGLIDRGLDLHRTYHYSGLVVEANGPQQIYEYIGNKAIMQDDFMIRHPLDFIPVPHVAGKKEDRIYERLSPMCKLGQLFIRMDHTEIKDELELFMRNPAGLHIIDALTMGQPFIFPSQHEVRDELHEIKEHRRKVKPQQSFNINNPLSIFEAM